MRKPLAALLLLMSAQALAAPIVYRFTGIVTSAEGVFAGQGTAVTGTFLFDDRLVDSNPSNLYVDHFAQGAPGVPFLPFSASIQVGTIAATLEATDPHFSSVGISDGFFPLPDPAPPIHDTVSFSVAPYSLGGEGFSLIAVDHSEVAVAPGSGHLTGSIAGAIDILDHLDLSLFHDLAYGRFGSYEGGALSSVEFTWTGLQRYVTEPDSGAVPEPSTLPLVAMALLGLLAKGRPWRQ